MIHLRIALGMSAAVLAASLFGVTPFTSSSALAMGSTPSTSPKVDCRKRKNRNKTVCYCKKRKNKSKSRCKNRQSGKLSDDQLYQVGYWLAQDGKFEEALSQLRQAQNQKDPTHLNYIGYSTRKLGRVDEALKYYRQALSENPDYTLARAYMGEAFLEQGKLDLAREQLSEIERRCGQSCVEFTALSGQIASFVSTGKFTPQGKRDEAVKRDS